MYAKELLKRQSLRQYCAEFWKSYLPRSVTTWSPLANSFNTKPSKKLTFGSKVISYQLLSMSSLLCNTVITFYINGTFRKDYSEYQNYMIRMDFTF